MAKVARLPGSYKNEERLFDLVPVLLEANGFSAAAVVREGGMKFATARLADGTGVKFWVKQAWSNVETFSAIQVTFLNAAAATAPDSEFVDQVEKTVAAAKARGASHALLVHMVGGMISTFAVLAIDKVTAAYRAEIAQWPGRARNTRSPTLYFDDPRGGPEACDAPVKDREVPLARLSGLAQDEESAAGSKKVTVEVERRMLQQVFRKAVGDRCQWRCVVSGVDVRAVLDAAHLPGRDWRVDNASEDGVMVRTDLHRLLDKGLAELRDGRFWVAESARVGEYAQLHERPLLVSAPIQPESGD